jgi:hypothetical protein
MVQSLYIVKDYTIRAMKIPDAAKAIGNRAQVTVVKATTHNLYPVPCILYAIDL